MDLFDVSTGLLHYILSDQDSQKIVDLSDMVDRILARRGLEAHRPAGGDESVRSVSSPHRAIVSRLHGESGDREVIPSQLRIVGRVHIDRDLAISEFGGLILELVTDFVAHVLVLGPVLDFAVDESRGDRESYLVAGTEAHHLDVFTESRELFLEFQREEPLGLENQPLSEPPLVGPSLVESPARTAHEEVVVSQGCTSHCSYCFSRLARGRLTSVPLSEIVKRVREAVGRGVAEVRLTSLDTSCWGMDLPGGERLPELLQSVAQVPGEFKVRLGMMSPQSLSPIRQELFEALQLVKFFRFLHLPVQSGSNAILDAMRRGYSVEGFRELVRLGRELCPELTVATDIIVGYPGETETDFELTCRLIEELGPEIVNVTRFSARPMTPAARLPLLPPRIAKRRSRRLTELRMQVARARFERWVGREEEALIVEHGPDGSTVGRLFNYLPVVLPQRLPLGSTWRVRVDGSRSTYLLGEATGLVREASGPP